MKVLMLILGFLAGVGLMLVVNYETNKSTSTYPYLFPQEGTVSVRYVGQGKAITIYEDNVDDFLRIVKENNLPAPDINNTIIKRDLNRADRHIISFTYAGDNVIPE